MHDIVVRVSIVRWPRDSSRGKSRERRGSGDRLAAPVSSLRPYGAISRYLVRLISLSMCFCPLGHQSGQSDINLSNRT